MLGRLPPWPVLTYYPPPTLSRKAMNSVGGDAALAKTFYQDIEVGMGGDGRGWEGMGGDGWGWVGMGGDGRGWVGGLGGWGGGGVGGRETDQPLARGPNAQIHKPS